MSDGNRQSFFGYHPHLHRSVSEMEEGKRERRGERGEERERGNRGESTYAVYEMNF